MINNNNVTGMPLYEFINIAAHDLKAPLRRINYYCQFLKEDPHSKLSEEGMEHIERIVANTARMEKLVGDLRTYALTATRMQQETETVDFAKAAEEAIAELDHIIRQSNAKIYIEALPQLPACADDIKTLFYNLIGNAVRYKGKDAPAITITSEDTGGKYTFSVYDNGEGIEEKYRLKIFSPFERLHSHDKIEGSGLGLALCRVIVQALGGEIWMEQREKEPGSIFKFTIPKNHAA